MADLTPYLVGSDETQEWPGTRLVGGGTSVRYTYRLCPELEVLTSAASDLFEWVNPALPEDLHFLREDGSTALGNIAQEDDAQRDSPMRPAGVTGLIGQTGGGLGDPGCFQRGGEVGDLLDRLGARGALDGAFGGARQPILSRRWP
jgi:hypothetical protein